MFSQSRAEARPEEIPGLNLVKPWVGTAITFKAIANDSGIAFFSKETQHKSVKVAGLSYEDDYKGNAVAIIFGEGRADIRYHREFKPGRLKDMLSKLVSDPQLTALIRSYRWYCIPAFGAGPEIISF